MTGRPRWWSFVAAGHSNKEIAERLDLSVKTVETYKARSREKLDLHSRAELVAHALCSAAGCKTFDSYVALHPSGHTGVLPTGSSPDAPGYITTCRLSACRPPTAHCDLSKVLMKTRGEIEAAICDGISRFHQDYMGRGPKDIRAHLIGDLLVVRLQGVLTRAEQQLARSLPAEKGRDLLKQVRTQLIERRGRCWRR